MDILSKHEIFEIEVLEKLKNGDFLRPLIFVGGTMLRLCYELNRYSTDLDFWFVKKTDYTVYFNKLKKYLARDYEVTDAQIKFNTLLLEIRSKNYPKRLKIEIRKELKNLDFQEKIAFSKYGTTQVMLKAVTLEQALKNKIKAALDRKDIRDFFDMEFLMRQGAGLKADRGDLIALRKIITGFKDKDYRVVLGSLLESDLRNYYVKNKFEFLIARIDSLGEKI